MKKTTRKVVAGVAAASFLLVGVTACNGGEEAKPAKPATEEAKDKPADDGKAKKPEYCGLQEEEGPEFAFGPFDAAIAFFQPAVMLSTPDAKMHIKTYEESMMHWELDLKANKFGVNWGYSEGETPAGLRIFYQILQDKKVINSGMMMEMNAVDGSHYGLNLPNGAIPGPGKYDVRITIYPPQTYDIHQDYITGVPMKQWYKALTAQAVWEVKQEQWDKVKKLKVEDPMATPEKCKEWPKELVKDPKAEEAWKKAEAEKPVPMTMDHS